MAQHDARVYDLDGTLVRLAVDWERVRRDVLEVYREHDAAASPEAGLWDLLEAADAAGLRRDVENTIAGHERRGAASSVRLELADEVAALECPVGVCSLNAEAACRIALETHGLAGCVDVVVGRDSVGAYKPDPAPLEAVVRELGVPADQAVFVGDSPRDREAARRAGVAFEAVEPRT